MSEQWKHDYRLSLQPAGFFTEALDRALANGPAYVGNESRIGEFSGGGTFAIFNVFDEDDRPHFFGLHVQLPDGEVTPELARSARNLFAQLIAMDDAARTIPRQHDENEELADVAILTCEGLAILHYYSTLWNSEWGVRFKLGADGNYDLLGIPDWRNPGKFIR